MKLILFDEKEIVLIKKTLHKRLLSLEKEEGRGVDKDVKTIEEVVKKLDSSWDKDKYYRPRHLQKITSCINEFLYPYKERRKELFNLSAIEFTILSSEDEKDMQLLDLCFGVLQKTGYRKSSFKFSDVHQKIERLKECQEIYLSRNDERHVYKIAFVNNQEVMLWEVGGRVNLVSDKFQKKSVEEMAVFHHRFTDYLDRNEARIIIKNCKMTDFTNDFLKFTKHLLN